MKVVITIFVFILTLSGLCAQERLLKGKTLDAETGLAVPFASVLVANKGKGIGARENGTFSFPVSNGDTLNISSIGYETLVFIIDFDSLNFSNVTPLKMMPTAYELDSVQVIKLTDDFYLKKPTFDTLDLGFVDPDAEFKDWDYIQLSPAANGQGGVGISGILNVFDKDIKQRKIIKAFEKEKAFLEERKALREK